MQKTKPMFGSTKQKQDYRANQKKEEKKPTRPSRSITCGRREQEHIKLRQNHRNFRERQIIEEGNKPKVRRKRVERLKNRDYYTQEGCDLHIYSICFPPLFYSQFKKKFHSIYQNIGNPSLYSNIGNTCKVRHI